MTRFGLIGRGRQGTRFISAKNGGGSIVEVIGRDTLGAIEERDGIDGWIIATPAATHAELAIRCLEAGKPVLVEKPLATTWKDCVRVIDLAERKGLPLLVGHTHLFSEHWQTRPEHPDTVYIELAGPCELSAQLDWGPHAVAMAIHALGKPTWSFLRKANDGAWAEWQMQNVRDSCALLCVGKRDEPARIADVDAWHYDANAPCEHTALWHQEEAFKRLCAGGTDERASYDFNRSVYRCLFGEP